MSLVMSLVRTQAGPQEVKASSLRGDLGLMRGCSGEGVPRHPGPLQDTARGDSALAGLRPGRFWWDLSEGRETGGDGSGVSSCPHPQSLERVAAAGRGQALRTLEVNAQDTCREQRSLRKMSAP